MTVTCEVCINCQVSMKEKELMIQTTVERRKVLVKRKVKDYYCRKYRESIGNLSRAEKCKYFASKREQSSLEPFQKGFENDIEQWTGKP